jgi:hypothetical protein
MYKIIFNPVISAKINKIINQGIKMLINQNNIAILKKDALQKLRIIFYVTMTIVFCFALQVGADEKNDIGAIIKAAEQGDAYAQYNLGVMYYNGKGVPQDYVTAYAWWNLSAANGRKTAVKNRDILSRKMTHQQIAQAQALSVKFQNKIDRANKQSDSSSTASKTSELDEQGVQYKKVHNKQHGSKSKKPLDSSQLLV